MRFGFHGGMPLTSCSSSLLNGACGGTTQEGKCEVDAEMDCGWLLIYQRLEKLGRLDKLLPFTKAKTIARKCPPRVSVIPPIGPWKKDKGGGSVWAFRKV